jgi:hypothetical protein
MAWRVGLNHYCPTTPLIHHPLETMHLINISSCTNIHSLYLVDIPTHMVYSRWLLDILSQITSHSLRALILDFSTPEDGSSWINSIDQKGVARILGDTKFDKLRTLGVDCRLRVGSVHNLEYIIERRRNPEVERFVSEGPLSDWNRRGILWFIYTDEWKSYKLR